MPRSRTAQLTEPAVIAPAGLPRILAGPKQGGAESLADHIARVGAMPRYSSSCHGNPALIEIVERSGLRGRGGSGFPTAVKMRAVASGRGDRVVVGNGSEGEPASSKDAFLLAWRPHLVLDGAMLAAAAVGASQIVVAIDRSLTTARRRLADAIDERRAAHHDPVNLRIVDLPSRYIAGEESALVHWVNGGDAKPEFVPPRPFEKGVRGRPTLIQNVETLGHLSLIARFGWDWFRAIGTETEPGSALLTVGGAVASPGVCEIAIGTTVGDVMRVSGGATEELSAFLLGGYFGAWIPATRAWNQSLGHLELQQCGAAFGCGVLYAFPARSCGLSETARVACYLAQESAGQCGPCVHGLAAIADALDSIVAGQRVVEMAGSIRRWCGQIAGRGACHLPDGAIRFVASALDTFVDDLGRHHQRGTCPAAHRQPLLPLPDPATREGGWR